MRVLLLVDAIHGPLGAVREQKLDRVAALLWGLTRTRRGALAGAIALGVLLAALAVQFVIDGVRIVLAGTE